MKECKARKYGVYGSLKHALMCFEIETQWSWREGTVVAKRCAIGN